MVDQYEQLFEVVRKGLIKLIDDLLPIWDSWDLLDSKQARNAINRIRKMGTGKRIAAIQDPLVELIPPLSRLSTSDKFVVERAWKRYTIVCDIQEMLGEFVSALEKVSQLNVSKGTISNRLTSKLIADADGLSRKQIGKLHDLKSRLYDLPKVEGVSIRQRKMADIRKDSPNAKKAKILQLIDKLQREGHPRAGMAKEILQRWPKNTEKPSSQYIDRLISLKKN